MGSERLSLSVIPGAGWSADDIRSVARAADDAGFEAIFTTEVNNDAIATAQLMGSATERIRVGTIPTFLGSDLAECRDAARQNLALYTGLPFFRRMWRSSGYVAEVEQMEAGDGAASLSDAMLDSFCLLGPVARCRERLAEYRSSGVDLPILGPPVGPGPARQVIDAFAA
ncbi:LLM class flavin-dependent oxidoreductase [Pseudonocardia benzenivorans]|uniref:Uncharacterized protein n=2 Tax=Pseudonocardia TaxID=1847 RepID=F4CK09_PSEUX|nr:LLM class flavin-dependent oxidoreductase [Pseudonocardia dioxanivorans]AEA28115.1 hypothetical protein Psed_6001 [Pseudonocardia dioxanivorans CB1190]GJF06181.1 hypothetical protein PSD17_51290 [Pseudonocardia sp. D17]